MAVSPLESSMVGWTTRSISSLNRCSTCKRLGLLMRRQSGTWLFSLMGNLLRLMLVVWTPATLAVQPILSELQQLLKEDGNTQRKLYYIDAYFWHFFPKKSSPSNLFTPKIIVYFLIQWHLLTQSYIPCYSHWLRVVFFRLNHQPDIFDHFTRSTRLYPHFHQEYEYEIHNMFPHVR